MKHYTYDEITNRIEFLRKYINAKPDPTAETMYMRVLIEIIEQLLREYDGERFEL